MYITLSLRSSFCEKVKKIKDTPHFGTCFPKIKVDDKVIIYMISTQNHNKYTGKYHILIWLRNLSQKILKIILTLTRTLFPIMFNLKSEGIRTIF